MDDPTDLDLCTRYRSGDQVAAAVLLERHGGLIGAVIQRLAPTARHHRDDMMQEGRMALLRAAHGYDPTMGAKFGTYAMTAIRRTLWQELQSLNDWNAANTADEYPGDVIAEESQPAPTLDTLPPVQARIVRMRYGYDGGEPLSFPVIAGRLGMEIRYVADLHADALNTLRGQVVARPA